MYTEPHSGCPINAALEVLGDAWALLVLRDVIFGNRRHFGELPAKSAEGISSNILAGRLKHLVDSGLLIRQAALRGQRGTYSLAEAGIQTVPVMVALGSWGLANQPGIPELRIRAELLRDGGPVLWQRLMDWARSSRSWQLGRPAARKRSVGRPDARLYESGPRS